LKNPDTWVEGATRIDRNVRDFCRQHPRDFRIIIVVQVLCRLILVVETYLVFYLLHKPTSFMMAFFVYSVGLLLNWLFSMIPGQIGVMEQSSDSLFKAMSYNPGEGFVFELVRRARRVFSIAVGLVALIILSLRSRRGGRDASMVRSEASHADNRPVVSDAR
jgi:uncharacterized membrane protein YbhN (UPF0104 family)